MRSDLCTLAAIVGAITARQEQIEYYLRNGAATFAILASIVAIYTRLRPGRPTSNKANRPPLD